MKYSGQIIHLSPSPRSDPPLKFSGVEAETPREAAKLLADRAANRLYGGNGMGRVTPVGGAFHALIGEWRPNGPMRGRTVKITFDLPSSPS